LENLPKFTVKIRHEGVAVPMDDSSHKDNTSIHSLSQEVNETPSNNEQVEDSLRLAVKNNELRYVVKKFVKQPVVENTILALIVINSIMMGIGTFDFISEHHAANEAFFYIDLVFLVIFTVEVGLTIFHMRCDAFTDAWVVFDFLIISLSWTLSSTGNFDPDGGDTQSVQVIRSLRIFRILSRIESLKAVMTALSRSLTSLLCLGVFCFIIMFIFAIFFTEEYGSLYEDGLTEFDYFSRLDITFFTLYQILTLDEWSNILREVMVTRPNAWIPFLIYVILTAFIIVNLVIAIICESIFTLDSADDKVKSMKKDMKDMELLMQSMRNEIIVHLETSGEDIHLLQSSVTDFENSPAALISRPALADHNEHGPDSAHNSSMWFKMLNSVINDERFQQADPNGNTKRAICGRIVNHEYVQNSIVALIIINSILLAIGTFNFVTENHSVNSDFDRVSDAFLVIYTIETAMQLIYHGLAMFKNGWHLFDFTLIIFSWIFQISPSFRAIRVLRIVHVLPKFEAMRTITNTLSKAIPKIGAIVGITLVFFYVFAVMCTTLFNGVPVGDGGLSYDYFSTIFQSLLTLFQIMTMAEWASISRELEETFWWAMILTSVFVTISGLLFVNAIVALICQAQEHVISKRKDKRQKERIRLSGSRLTFDKSYNDRVFDIKAMHAEIIGLINQSDINRDKSSGVISYQSGTRSQSDTHSISNHSDDIQSMANKSDTPNVEATI